MQKVLLFLFVITFNSCTDNNGAKNTTTQVPPSQSEEKEAVEVIRPVITKKMTANKFIDKLEELGYFD